MVYCQDAYLAIVQVELFNAVENNGYKIVYLSARAIGQVRIVAVTALYICGTRIVQQLHTFGN